MPLIPQVGREHFKIRTLLISISIFLWIGILLHLFPVWWMFTTSIKPSYEIFKFPPTLWPKQPTFICYKIFFALASRVGEAFGQPMYVYFKNSCIMTGAILITQIPICALSAYALSKLHSATWNRILFLFYIGTMMIPGILSFIPNYLLMSHFPFPSMNIPTIPFTNVSFPTYRFINTYWAVIFLGMYNAFNFLLFKGFFDGIPDELINAARLDGASELSIFRRIIIPMSKPVFAVVAYLCFSSSWNNFMWPLVVLKKENLYPLSVVLFRFQYQLQYYAPDQKDPVTQKLIASGIGYNGLMAMAIIESIPVFIMFIIFREYLMKGIKLRGFK